MADEKMQIVVELTTQQAVNNGKALAETVRELAKEAGELDRKVEDAGKSIEETGKKIEKTGGTAKAAAKKLKEAGDAAADTGKQIEKTGDTTEKAREKLARIEKAVDKLKESMEKTAPAAARAGSAVENVGRKGGPQITSTAERTRGLNSLLQAGAKSAAGFVAGFAGLGAVVHLLRQAGEEIRNQERARGSLVQDKWRLDEATASVRDNLGLRGAHGERIAGKLVLDLAERIGGTIETSANLIGAGTPYGLDVRDPKSSDTLSKVGVMLARGDISSRLEIDRFMRVMSNAVDVKNPKAVQDFLAKTEEAMVMAPSSNPSEFLSGMTQAVPAAMAAGVPYDEALSQYTAMVATSATARSAAERTRQLYMLAQFREPEAREAVAKEAEKRGFLGDVALPPQEIERRIATSDKAEAAQIRILRAGIGDDERGIEIDEKQWEASRERRERAARTRNGRKELELAEQEHRERMESRKRALQDDRDRLKRLETEFAGVEQSEASQAALVRMAPVDRVRMLQKMAADAKTPEQRQAFTDLLGGQQERGQALLMSASDSTQELQRHVQASMNRPDRFRRMQQRERLFFDESMPMRNRAMVDSLRKNINETDRPEERYQLLKQRAAEAVKRQEAGGKYTLQGAWKETSGTGNITETINFAKLDGEHKEAIATRDLLMKEMDDFLKTLTPEEQSRFGTVTVLRNQLNDSWREMKSSGNSTLRNRNTANFARAFYDAQQKVIDSRRVREEMGVRDPVTGQERNPETGEIMPGPTGQVLGPRPSDYMTDTPQADERRYNRAGGGATINHYYNQTVGNMYMQPGDDALPGRLDDYE